MWVSEFFSLVLCHILILSIIGSRGPLAAHSAREFCLVEWAVCLWTEPFSRGLLRIWCWHDLLIPGNIHWGSKMGGKDFRHGITVPLLLGQYWARKIDLIEGCCTLANSFGRRYLRRVKHLFARLEWLNKTRLNLDLSVWEWSHYLQVIQKMRTWCSLWWFCDKYETSIIAPLS